GIEKNVRFGNATEQIVKIAHDVLISADHEDAEIIHFARNDAVERQRVAHVLQIGKLGNLAIRIAGDIHERSLSIRRGGQPMNRHDWKKLAERPVIEERLEDGKITDVLIAERSLELFDFFRNITQSAVHVHDLLRELPIKRVDLG